MEEAVCDVLFTFKRCVRLTTYALRVVFHNGIAYKLLIDGDPYDPKGPRTRAGGRRF